MKLWGGRFDKAVDETLETFGASIGFDKILWQDDLLGSIAHIKGLYAAKLLSEEEVAALIKGLKSIGKRLADGAEIFKIEDEDIHMNIERLLFEEIGELAGKIHTSRSRNDQVALDMRLFMRRHIAKVVDECASLLGALLSKAQQHIDVIIPAYTHLQRAQPIRLGHHFLAYAWMIVRDIERFKLNFIATNKLPLGAGAVAGSSFGVDQTLIAQLLNFDAIYENSLDAVSDRDYLVEFLSAASLLMLHLSKLCEELIIWSSQEFSFVEIDDALATGSSMMPQKKNPDAAELVRGKTGRVYGSLFSMLTMLKGLPLAYNKDMQEDKEGVFDTIRTVNGCIQVMTKLITTLKINETSITQSLSPGFLSATELANYLVRKGLTFRRAHEIIGRLVKFCVAEGKTFEELTLLQLQKFSELFTADVIALLSVQDIVERYNNLCGTAKSSILHQLEKGQEQLEKTHVWLDEIDNQIGETSNHFSFTEG